MNQSALNPSVAPGRGRHVAPYWIFAAAGLLIVLTVAVWVAISGRVADRDASNAAEEEEALVSPGSGIAPAIDTGPGEAAFARDGFIPAEGDRLDPIDLGGEGDFPAGSEQVTVQDAPVILNPYAQVIAEAQLAAAERLRKEMEDRHLGQMSGMVISTRELLPSTGQDSAGAPPAAVPGPSQDPGLAALEERNAFYNQVRDAISGHAGTGLAPKPGAGDSFLGENPGGYSQHTRTPPISPWELKAGTVIPAVLITGIQSDLPGYVMGQVSQNIYDSASGRHVLIPQGSRLFGEYDSRVAYGQRRLTVAWRRLSFPDGSTIELERMPGSDPGGYSGFTGKVKNHYLRTFGQITLLSALQSIPEAVARNSERSGQTNGLEEIAAANYSEAGKELLQRNLSIKPRITVPAGYRFLVTVHRDLIFPGAWQ